MAVSVLLTKIALPLLMEVAKLMVSVVASRVMEEFRYMVHFKKELRELQEKIQIIAGIVGRMTAVPDATVEQWLKKTVRIIRNAEDMMDVLAYEEQRCVVMNRRPKKTFRGKVRRVVFLPLERLYIRREMGRWIRKINRDIGELVNKARFINDLTALVHSASYWQPAAVLNTTDNQQAMLRRNVDTSLFVGRDADVAAVVHMLGCNLSQDSRDNICPNCLSVVAIVGIGEEVDAQTY